MLIYCIKKNDLYLAYKLTSEESDYEVVPEFNMQISGQYFWTEDEDLAKQFLDQHSALSFLSKRRGEFWVGAEVDKI